MSFAWLLAYACGILLALMGASLAPVVLAVGVPGAFLLLRPLREERAVAAWTLMTVAGALGFWRLSGGGSPRDVQALVGLAIIAGVPFAGWANRNRSLGGPLALLAVFAMLVGYFSSGQGGPGFMERWLMSLGLDSAHADSITIAFRKTVHFTFYGSVGLTSLWVARRATEGDGERVRTALLAALALASFDELRQSTFSNRTGSAWDVLLDMAGAATFVGLSRWAQNRKR